MEEGFANTFSQTLALSPALLWHELPGQGVSRPYQLASTSDLGEERGTLLRGSEDGQSGSAHKHLQETVRDQEREICGQDETSHGDWHRSRNQKPSHSGSLPNC
jgi:hypothetical protein